MSDFSRGKVNGKSKFDHVGNAIAELHLSCRISILRYPLQEKNVWYCSFAEPAIVSLICQNQ